MRFRLSLLFVAVCALLGGGAEINAAAAAGASQGADADEAALLCGNAPSDFVKPMPAPFNFWMVIVCGPQSQALVPIEGMVWFAHGTEEAISILALPPEATPLPKTDDYDPSYGVRFKSLFATEVKGEKLKRAVSILSTAQENSMNVLPAAEVERVYQLDAVSNIYDMRYNIYFYIRGTLPQAAIACIDACNKFLYFDILTDSAAKKRVAASALRP